MRKPAVSNKRLTCITAAASAVALTACGAVSDSAVTAPLGKAAGTAAFCGPDDMPETGMQGQTSLADMVSRRSQDPYFCGLKIVGHNDVMNRGANWQLARVGDCAYMATPRRCSPRPTIR